MRNGQECEKEGRCYSGQCQKRSDQCKKFFGKTAKVNEECMEAANNKTRGDYSGNCGEMYLLRESFYECAAPTDYLCGKIQCEHGSATLQQLEYRDVDVRSRTVDGANCKYVDWRKSRDLAGTEMVWYEDRIPQGTPCGPESVCSYKRENIFKTYETFSECISLEELREQNEDYAPCPENCNGRGICNSRGNCHCDKPYGGRSCSDRGYGGSVDSGPMVRHVLDLNMVSYSVVFGLLFLIAFIVLVIYKFHFGRNISEICFYQPCPGKSAVARAKAAQQRNAEASQNLNRNRETTGKPASAASHDVFNQWGDNPNHNIAKSPPKRPKNPAEKHKPVYLQELQTKKPVAVQPTADPFAVSWGDSESEVPPISTDLKKKRAPPNPPAPPKDYETESAPPPLPKDY